ncbi:MAG: hypothetical protein A4E72_01402 [Syntrophus sp. PtaU1.Bin208]|nr:MAG: hypothetical protein A4E72_01402 [Syntrophus sp. PtaU1.Bin208]
MRGYPKHIATRQDFINLLGMEEYKARALTDLRALYETPDDTYLRVVSGSEKTGDLVTEEVPAPNPLWKQKGFESRDAVAELIIEYGGEV